MNTLQKRFASVAATSLIGAGAFIGVDSLAPKPVYAAGASSFYCGQASGAPATLAKTASGKSVPVIRWTSSTFNSAGWNQSKRCQVVSERFELYRKQGSLKYLTTGRMNGQAVICTAARKGGPCAGLLYTLKPGQDPTKTLAELLDVRTKAKGPLNETTSRLYLKMNDVLDAKSGISPSLSPSTTDDTPSSAATTEALW